MAQSESSAAIAKSRLRSILLIDRSPKDHSLCKFSTGICGSLTAGQGVLDNNGYWEMPCYVCPHDVPQLEKLYGLA